MSISIEQIREYNKACDTVEDLLQALIDEPDMFMDQLKLEGNIFVISAEFTAILQLWKDSFK